MCQCVLQFHCNFTNIHSGPGCSLLFSTRLFSIAWRAKQWGFSLLHVTCIRATPQWHCYVRNISSTMLDEFALPPPSLRCFTQQEKKVQTPATCREYIRLLVCLAQKNKLLSWTNQTDGTDGWQTDIQTERREWREEKKAGRKETSHSQSDWGNARGVGLRDKNPLDIASWTRGVSLFLPAFLSICPPPPLPALSPHCSMLTCTDHLGKGGLSLQRQPWCQLPPPTDLGLWKALFTLLQTQ